MIGFLVEKDIWEDDEERILNTLSEKEVPFVVHDFLDFNPEVAKQLSTPEVFCYGSLQWIDQIQKHGDSRLKTICTMGNFDCMGYYQNVSRFLFNHSYWFLTLRDFINSFDKLMNQHDGQVFMRPSTGFKNGSISGGIFNNSSFKEHISFFEEAMDDNDWVVVDSVKHIDYEWRAIIRGNRCNTGCQYESFDQGTQKLGFDPTPDFPDRVKAKAEEIAAHLHGFYHNLPDPMYVMDIVESNGKLSLMELNALSTSGWYDCNTGLIIDAIQDHFDV